MVCFIRWSDRAEHDARVTAVLKWVKSVGATLNPDKCEFGKTCLKFLGHVIDQNGIRADPDKTTAIVHMSPPTTVSELRQFMGMVNLLGKFTPRLAELTQPLQELLSKSTPWVWTLHRNMPFLKSKRNSPNQPHLPMLLTRCPILSVGTHKLRRRH